MKVTHHPARANGRARGWPCSAPLDVANATSRCAPQGHPLRGVLLSPHPPGRERPPRPRHSYFRPRVVQRSGSTSVGQNISEVGNFSSKGKEETLEALFEIYNTHWIAAVGS